MNWKIDLSCTLILRAILVGIVPRLFHAVNDPARKNCFKTTLKWKKSIFHDVFKNKLSVYDLKYTPTYNRTHIWPYCMAQTVWKTQFCLNSKENIREDTVSSRLGITQVGIMSARKAFMGNHSFGTWFFYSDLTCYRWITLVIYLIIFP